MDSVKPMPSPLWAASPDALRICTEQRPQGTPAWLLEPGHWSFLSSLSVSRAFSQNCAIGSPSSPAGRLRILKLRSLLDHTSQCLTSHLFLSAAPNLLVLFLLLWVTCLIYQKEVEPGAVGMVGKHHTLLH